jgi:hypothetical protein
MDRTGRVERRRDRVRRDLPAKSAVLGWSSVRRVSGSGGQKGTNGGCRSQRFFFLPVRFQESVFWPGDSNASLRQL